MATTLQGMNDLVKFYKRVQSADDDIGGSVQTLQEVYSGVHARIGNSRVPFALRVQGMETSDMFDAVVQAPGLTDIVIYPDYVMEPQTGQYQGLKFAVLSVQDDSIASSPGDMRRHKQLSLRRFEVARQVQ